MINRYPILACCLTAALVAYLCFALPMTASMAKNDHLAGCKINVSDTANTQFVTAQEVSQECGDILSWIKTRRRGEISLHDLETTLRASDKIEKVNVCLLNNNVLSIDVEPMVPVARVFDTTGSYYINAVGKKITADPRYHVDVPVVVGHFTESRPASALLPLLQYIARTPELDALVSTVKQTRSGDIIIVPAIRGHVVNFGDNSICENKFHRLREFYRQIMPVRGWETYDTIAVKWRGQVVASRRDKALQPTSMASKEEEFDDLDDLDTMISPLHSESNDSIKKTIP